MAKRISDSDAFKSLEQGTTLAWTGHYGDLPASRRLRELLRDALFATALAICVWGAAGFVSFEPAPLVAAVQAKAAL